MTAVATDPCVAAATKAAQALGCVVLKPEQTQVITGVLRGRDVFAVCLLATERRCVTLSHPLRSTSSILAVYHQLLLLTAIMRAKISTVIASNYDLNRDDRFVAIVSWLLHSKRHHTFVTVNTTTTTADTSPEPPSFHSPTLLLVPIVPLRWKICRAQPTHSEEQV